MKHMEMYEDRFDLKGVRFFAENQKKTVYVSSGYRVVKGTHTSYVTGNKETHSAKFENYMLQVGSVKVFEEMKDLYTQDLVDFVDENGIRTAGVIIYDNTNFLVAVKDFKGENHPLHACKIMCIFPHIYERPDLINMPLSDIYIKLGMKMREELPDVPKEEAFEEESAGSLLPGEDLRAQLERNKPVPIPSPVATETVDAEASPLELFIGVKKSKDSTLWQYRMEYSGKKAGNTGSFNKLGNEGYYTAASLAIALSKINTPAKKTVPIRIHTESKVLHNILMGGLLDVWSSTGWIKDNGEVVKNSEVLITIKDHLDRLGGDYSVVLHEEAPLCWTA